MQMNSKHSIYKIFFERDIYAFVCLGVVIYKELFMSHGFFLKQVLPALGPVFSFSMMTYLSLTVFHYLCKKSKYSRLAVIFFIAILWIFLCGVSKAATVLTGNNSSYFALLACGYSIFLDVLRKNNVKI